MANSARTRPKHPPVYYRLSINSWQLIYEHGIDWRADGPGARIFWEGPSLTMDVTFEKPASLAGRDMVARAFGTRRFDPDATSARYGEGQAPQSICTLTFRKGLSDLLIGIPQDSLWQIIQLMKLGAITKLALRGAPLFRGSAEITNVEFTTSGEDEDNTDLDAE